MSILWLFGVKDIMVCIFTLYHQHYKMKMQEIMFILCIFTKVFVKSLFLIFNIQFSKFKVQEKATKDVLSCRLTISISHDNLIDIDKRKPQMIPAILINCFIHRPLGKVLTSYNSCRYQCNMLIDMLTDDHAWIPQYSWWNRILAEILFCNSVDADQLLYPSYSCDSSFTSCLAGSQFI